MKKTMYTSAVVAAAALLAAGCGRSGGSPDEEARTSTAPAAQQDRPAGDFGDLKGLCGPGDAKSASAQGVTADTIKVGVLSDVGFTKNPEYADASKVFTSWCNDAGGVNGRKLQATVRDTRMTEVRARVLDSCKQDFALVGGSAALDGMAVKDRLSCLLPEFPSQSSMIQSNGSDLQLNQTGGTVYARYAGFYQWLLTEKYPDSKQSLAIISGDSPVVKPLTAQSTEVLQSLGGKVTYNDLYPASGVSDWTPYAQKIKDKGVKGMVFYGSFAELAKLEQILTTMNYKLDWIDPNNNSYGPAFIQLTGKALDFENNVTDLSGVYPLEKASGNPATQQVVGLYKKYAPKAQITVPALRAFSAWALFVKSAKACGDDLTRRCVYEQARKEKTWTGGGLLAPVDLTSPTAPLNCFNVEHATSKGWEPADFGADNGAYRCGLKQYKYKGDYGKALTLADIGKSIDDLK